MEDRVMYGGLVFSIPSGYNEQDIREALAERVPSIMHTRAERAANGDGTWTWRFTDLEPTVPSQPKSPDSIYILYNPEFEETIVLAHEGEFNYPQGVICSVAHTLPPEMPFKLAVAGWIQVMYELHGIDFSERIEEEIPEHWGESDQTKEKEHKAFTALYDRHNKGD